MTFKFKRFRGCLLAILFLCAVSAGRMTDGVAFSQTPEGPSDVSAEKDVVSGVDSESETTDEPSEESETPGDTELMTGIRLFYEGKPDAAYDAFDLARQLNPDLAPAGVLTAILASQKGDVAAVHRYLNRAIAESPEDPEAWFRLARVAADEDRVPELDLLLTRANALLETFLASKNLEADVRLQFLKGEAISLAARLAQARGDWAGAESRMRDYLALNPTSDEGWISLGYLLLEQGKNDEAVAAFDQARRLNPERFPGWLTAVSLLNEKGDRPEAEKRLAGHDTETDLTVADLVRIASLLHRWGRTDDARRILERLPSDSPERHKMTGLFYYENGEFEEAETEYQAALLKNPRDEEALVGFILALADQKNQAKRTDARKKAEDHRKTNPNSDEAVGILAWTEFLLGHVERAEDLLLPILDRGSLTPTNAYYLARVAAVRGDFDLARQLLDGALDQSDPFSKRKEAEEFRDLLMKSSGDDDADSAE